MPDLPTLMVRVTGDLRFIHVLLEDAARTDSDPTHRKQILEQLAGSSCLEELKAAVDNMRHLLWSYVEAQSGRQTDISRALQSVRMKRVTEMLKTLQPDVQQSRLAPTPEADHFLEMVTKIAKSTVDRHKE
ncbi:MAG: hypothetical protein HYX26_01470 [Acidobacteriales bacterium]|nr:hypothetical protein [Terriglobales bacterium]